MTPQTKQYRKQFRKKYSRFSRIKHIDKHTKKQYGGGIFNSVGKFVFNPNAGKNYKTPLNSVSKILNPASLERSLTQQQSLFQIIYNYNTPKPININTNKTQPIPSSLVEFEPHIIISNMYRYLITLVDDAPYYRLLWLAEFANYTKQRTILSYLSPKQSSNIAGKHNYSIKIYLYPKDVQPYTTLNISPGKRKPEYTNFMTYLKLPQNKNKIVLLRNYPLNIINDTSSGISLFSVISKKIKKKNNSLAKIAAHST